MKRKIRNRIVWTTVNLCRLLLSFTFILSGTVKLIDPKGTEYKIQDYLAALGFADTLFASVPLLLAVIISACEFVMGIYMLFGIQRRLTSTGMLLFLVVMTPFTLFLAVANPVSDCGCFGDAIKLTNWQTFGKNVVLLAAVVMVLRYYRLMKRAMTKSVDGFYLHMDVCPCLCFLQLVLSAGSGLSSLSHRSRSQEGADVRCTI